VGSDCVIVSDKAGTTRDAIEKVIDLKGIPLRLTDTAGVRDTFDDLEKFGIQKSLESCRSSDLQMVLFSASGSHDDYVWEWREPLASAVSPRKSFFVLNKADFILDLQSEREKLEVSFLSFLRNHIDPTIEPDQVSIISCKTGHGISEFTEKLCKIIKKKW
jgi:tRNA modification GTPase